LAQRLRWIAKRPDWALANEAFAEIRAHYSDLDGAAVLASALLQNARHAEAGRRWAHAARYWVWYAAVSGDVTKSSRNLVQCARSPTKVRHDREAVLQSLCIWQLLAALDPRSDEARQGIVWCHASLARRAEEQGDFATAQDQWSKVLEVAPSDPSATEGLQRVLEWRKKRAGSPESRSAAQALYGRLKQRTRPDYKSQVAAGFRMLHAGAPDLALDFAEAALRRNRGGEASILYLQCCVALERYGEAATVLGSVTDDAKAAALPAMDVQELLTHIPQDLLPLEFVAGLAQRADAGAFASVLLPILIQHDLKLAVFRLAEKTTRIPPITAPIILQVADYLWRMGEEGRTVEFLAGLSRDPAAADLFQHYASHLSAERLEQILLPSTGEQHGGEIWLTLAEYHHRQGDVHRATETLHRGVKEGELPRRFYGDNKSRIASLVLGLLDNGGESLEIPERLADVIAQWALPQVKAFFSSPEFSDLCQELAENSRFAIAPEHSRLGSLREGYFEYHMERRENRSPESYETDFAICEAALEYFDTLARMRPAEQVPVSAALRARLATTGFSLGSGSADAMMSYAILRDRPHCDLVSSSLFDEMAAWYVTEFASRNKIPSCCMSAAVTASLNAADHAFARVGTVVTRFAGTLRQQSEVWKDSYDPANPLDTLLFSLELVASVLPLHPNYRFLIGNMLPATDAVAAFADLCIAALAGRNGELDVPFSALLNQRAIPTRPVPVRTGGMHAPQDVLLIGHGSEGTGLGRNTRMLAEGLQAAGVGLSMLSYESPAEEFSRDLLRWWNRCETDPIVVAAVNAQDVPTLFVKDGHNILDRCHVAGFFLWETSKAPRIQHLGIRLVNEIWVPTHYVGSVYAPYAPVHVIGKGLFSGAESAKPQLPPSAPVRFLTVFDFHSSIERKNPVASVVAFQKAFTAGENVELIVKASNVNPQHPGNIFAQWERLCAASKGDPRIRIIVERYSEEQMRELLLVASCIVSLHRAEGFGYILSDAMALGIPVVATGYSGNTDFCSAETSFPVSYRLVPVKSSGAHWEDEGTEWAEPDIDSAVAQMRAVYCDYPAALKKAAAAAAAIRSQYSVERFSGTLRARLAAIRKDAGVDPASVIVQ
jgi:glycosyltransferase involved in cell wall biosynthesis